MIGRVSTAQYFARGSSQMVRLNAQLTDTQSRISSGLRVMTPSDDPVAAAQAFVVDAKSAQTKVFSDAANYAQSHLSLVEDAMKGGIDALADLQTTIGQANSAILTSDDRKSLAAQAQGALQELLKMANAQDGQGNYLFAGSQTKTQPFAMSGTTSQYLGDGYDRVIKTGPTQVSQVDYNGAALFQMAKTGQSGFQVNAAAGNAGDAYAGSISAPLGAAAGPYSIAFSGTTGSLTATVTDSSGTVVSTAPWAENGSVTFNGISVGISGKPAVGDSFTVGAAQTTSVLDAAAKVAQALNDPNLTASQLKDVLSNASFALSSGRENMISAQSHLGVTSAGLDTTISSLQTQSDALKTQKANLVGLDYNQAISDLAAQKLAYEASQSSFGMISKMSLFNYLS